MEIAIPAARERGWEVRCVSVRKDRMVMSSTVVLEPPILVKWNL